MAEDQTINVINPDGDLVAIPSAKANDALQSGYRIPTQAEQHAYNQQVKYGEGTLNEVKAFGEGAGRGLTFGATDYLSPKLGISSAEDIAGRKQYNPDSAIGGEIFGAVAPTLLAPESIAGRLPVGLLGRGARLAEEGIAGIGEAAARLAPEGSLAARGIETAGNMAAKTLAGAGEGAAFGAGQAFSEDALGNPEPLGESLLANMGYGAMWGGGLGGLIGAGEAVIPKAAAVAKEGIGSAYGKLFGKAIDSGAGVIAEEGAPTLEPGLFQKGVGKVMGFAGGPEAEEAFMQKAANPESAVPMSQEERSIHKDKTSKVVQEGIDDVQTLKKNIEEQIKPDATQEILENHPVEKPRIALADTLSNMKNSQEIIETDKDIYFPKQAKDLAQDIDGLERRLGEKSTSADIFNNLERVDNRLYKEVERLKDATDQRAIESRQVISDLRESIRRTLENPEYWGNAASSHAKYAAASRDLEQKFGPVEKNFMTSNGSGKNIVDPSKIGGMLNKANEPEGQMKMEYLRDYLKSAHSFSEASEEYHQYSGVPSDKEAFQKRLTDVDKRFSTTKQRYAANPAMGHGMTTDILTHGLSLLGGLPGKVTAAVIRGIANPNELIGRLSRVDGAAQKVGKVIDNLAKKAYEPLVATAEASKEATKKVLSKEDVDKKIEETTKRVKSVENMHDELDKATRPLSGVAPNITGAAQRALINGALFLHSKIPDWSDNTTAKPFDNKKPMSWAQNQTFMRYYNAVEDPISVMKDAVSGKSNPQGIETLNTVYPNLYGNMKQSLLNEIVSKKAKNEDLTISYPKRIVLSEFLGVNLDSSMNPSNIMANQAIMSSKANEKKQQEQATINPSQKGLSNINIADRYQTAIQRSVSRDEA